jgi:hypothetical protein
MSVDCFYTTVVNISGGERVFGFLGKHGRRLDADEQYTVPGDLRQVATRNRRTFQALERAVGGYTDSGGNVHPPSLAIIKTPAVHLWDSTLTRNRMLTLANGVLGVADPCAGHYESALSATITPIADGTAAVATATVTFSDAVTGFGVSDVHLTRGGVEVTPLTGVTVASADGGKTWTISGLATHTTTNGNYVLRVESTSSGITDAFGHTILVDVSEAWTKS